VVGLCFEVWYPHFFDKLFTLSTFHSFMIVLFDGKKIEGKKITKINEFGLELI
jgi:hypothetical protein